MPTQNQTEQRRKWVARRRTYYQDRYADKLTAARIDYREDYPIGPYFADFFIPSKMLVIEIDGNVHDTKKQQLRDYRRTRYFRALGFEVVRVTNEEVCKAKVGWVKTKPKVAPNKVKAALDTARYDSKFNSRIQESIDIELGAAALKTFVA